ncbi:prephenate dehydrogenase [Streptomyces sp. NPDC019890]|uniref:prephenate dehydrogenase n=1 Tax=Streptomyces sp. NPDC019890 TaxID=3365064 RepID=UPI00384B10D8
MRTAAVVGTGLIGTSVALALTRGGIRVHLIDTDPSAARTAAALGAGTLAPPRAPVDLAVLAVPPSQVAPVFADRQRAGLALSYTDVAGVKRAPERAFAVGGVDTSAFIGGHPLAGRERSGPLGAHAGLFQDRTWVLTPTPDTGPETLNRALSLVAACGAVPMVMDSPLHDRLVALVSHVPHVVAALMAARLAHAPDVAARLAGPELRDVTRIAASDPGLWSDILAENSAEVADVLDALAADLSQTIGALRGLSSAARGDAKAADMARLTDLLSRGVTGQARVPGTDARAQAGSVPVSVAFGDEPGALAELLARVGELAGPVGRVTTEYPVGRPGGLARFMVAPVRARDLVHRLNEEGWMVHSAGRRRRSQNGRPVRHGAQTGGAPVPVGPPGGRDRAVR